MTQRIFLVAKRRGIILNEKHTQLLVWTPTMIHLALNFKYPPESGHALFRVYGVMPIGGIAIIVRKKIHLCQKWESGKVTCAEIPIRFLVFIYLIYRLKGLTLAVIFAELPNFSGRANRNFNK